MQDVQTVVQGGQAEPYPHNGVAQQRHTAALVDVFGQRERDLIQREGQPLALGPLIHEQLSHEVQGGKQERDEKQP